MLKTLNRLAMHVPMWLHRIVYLGLSYWFIRWLWQIRSPVVLSGWLIFVTLALVSAICFLPTFRRSVAARLVLAVVDVLLPVFFLSSMIAMRILRVSDVFDVIGIPLLLSIPVMFGLSLFLGEDGHLHFHDTKA